MTRARATTSVAAPLVALTLAVAACGGDDDEEASTTPAPPAQPPSQSAPAPGGPGSLPPEFFECAADQGFEVEPSEIHSLPPQVLQRCFAALHGGGGTP